jgi:hypothetical protein
VLSASSFFRVRQAGVLRLIAGHQLALSAQQARIFGTMPAAREVFPSELIELFSVWRGPEDLLRLLVIKVLSG